MENWEEYKRFTKTRHWKGISKLNGVEPDSFGTKKELRILHKYLEPEEVVFALTSGIMSQTFTANRFDFGANTWLAVLTNERFLFVDCAMLTSSVDTQSVFHDRVQAVSASQGWLLGKIIIDIGNRSIVIDNCQKPTVSVFADLANKLLRELKVKNQPAPAHVSPTQVSPLDQIGKLGILKEFGVLTDDEVETAKEKIIQQTVPTQVSSVDQIEKLGRLKEQGVLTNDEFETAKARLIKKM